MADGDGTEDLDTPLVDLVPVRERLFDTAVIESTDGDHPVCAARIDVERDGTEYTLIRFGNRLQPDLDEERMRKRGHRIPLAGAPIPSRRGTGMDARSRRRGEADEELHIRPVVASDATWLSRHGFEGRLSIPMLEELVERRSAGRPTDESTFLLGMPRIPPHAFAYRIGDDSDNRTWFRVGSRWLDRAELVREELFGAGLPPRVKSVFTLIESRPWAPGFARGIWHLLADDFPRQRVQSWGLSTAMRLVNREVRATDELVGLLLCAPEDVMIDAATLGPDLARIVTRIGEHVAQHLDDECEQYEAWLEEEDIDDDGEGFEYDPTLIWIAALRDPEFSVSAGELTGMLGAFVEMLEDPDLAE